MQNPAYAFVSYSEIRTLIVQRLQACFQEQRNCLASWIEMVAHSRAYQEILDNWKLSSDASGPAYGHKLQEAGLVGFADVDSESVGEAVWGPSYIDCTES